MDRGRAMATRDKQLLSLHREYRKLLDIKHSAPLLELDEPYQRGWVRFFRLREDASHRKDVDKLLEILDKINVFQYCRKGTFMQCNPRTGKTEPIGHHPKIYNVGEWEKLAWSGDYARYFEIRLVTELNWKNQPVRNQRYVFIYPFYFVSHIEKHFVTHQRVAMPDIEKRIAEIENYFEQHQCWSRLNKLFGVPGYRTWNRIVPDRTHANYLAICAELKDIEDESF